MVERVGIRTWCRRRRFRFRGLAVGLAAWAALTAMAAVAPRAGGYGTHTQLGLPTCGFLAETGYPCPGCGMTTAMTAMAHGRIALATRANLFGVLLFLAVVVLAGLGTIEAMTGRDVLRLARPRLFWLWIALGGLLLGWGINVGWGVLEGRYPLWR